MIENILIGSINYSIDIRSGLRNDDDEKLLGDISYDNQVIRMENRLKPDKFREVLLHEVLHGVLDHSGVEEQKEYAVDTVAKGLAAVLVHNPEFTKLFL